MESERQYRWVQQCLPFLASFKAKWNLLLSSVDIWPTHKDYVGLRLVNQGESGNSTVLKASLKVLISRTYCTDISQHLTLTDTRTPASFPIYCSSLSGMLCTFLFSLFFFFSWLFFCTF